MHVAAMVETPGDPGDANLAKNAFPECVVQIRDQALLRCGILYKAAQQLGHGLRMSPSIREPREKLELKIETLPRRGEAIEALRINDSNVGDLSEASAQECKHARSSSSKALACHPAV